MFYRCHLKEHAQDGLSAMNCNHWQNTKTINKQIGFLEASSVPLTRPGWSLPMRQAVSSSEIRLWCTTPSLIYSCWFAVCIFGRGRVWVCVTESERDCVCSQPSVCKSGCCCEWCVWAHHVCVHRLLCLPLCVVMSFVSVVSACPVCSVYMTQPCKVHMTVGKTAHIMLYEHHSNSGIDILLQFFGCCVFLGFLCCIL